MKASNGLPKAYWINGSLHSWVPGPYVVLIAYRDGSYIWARSPLPVEVKRGSSLTA